MSRLLVWWTFTFGFVSSTPYSFFSGMDGREQGLRNERHRSSSAFSWLWPVLFFRCGLPSWLCSKESRTLKSLHSWTGQYFWEYGTGKNDGASTKIYRGPVDNAILDVCPHILLVRNFVLYFLFSINFSFEITDGPVSRKDKRLRWSLTGGPVFP